MNRRSALEAAGDYRIKATLGITGWLHLSVHSDGAVRHLDVGSSYPGGEDAPKGLAVRQLKRYASWVQTVKESYHIARYIVTLSQSESHRMNFCLTLNITDRTNHITAVLS